MCRDAVVGGLVATLAALGCNSANRPEATQPTSLAYTTPLSNAGTVQTEPLQKAAGPPRLVREGPNPRREPDAPRASAGTPTDANPHALRGLGIGGGPRPTLEPSATIPAPPAALSFAPRAGVVAPLVALPAGVPTGNLNRDALEGPLRDRMRFERCRIPNGTRVFIDALIYNGAAVAVDVRSTPSSRALDFCIEQVVRETSWTAQLAVNRVSLRL
jgi:hypothetical protein